MTQQLRVWAEILSKLAVPVLVAVLTLMWQSSERHSSDMENRMKNLEQSIQQTQLTVATLTTQITTGIHDRMDNQDRRMSVIETHQDKEDDRINQLETRK